jgi:integrase
MYEINKDKFLSPLEIKERKALVRDVNTRDAILIDIALSTGARSQEILNLRPRDFDEAQGTIYIRGVKNSRDRELPLPNYLAIKLKAFLGNLNLKPEEMIFPISTRRFRQIWAKYKPEGKSLKSCRHGLAMELFKKTRDIRLVQNVLGHRNINNTLVYADYVYKTEELKKFLTFGEEA